MPADASIFSQIQPVRPRNMLADFADISQIQGLQQRQQLVGMQMDEHRRGLEEQNALLGVIRTPGFSLDNPEHRNRLVMAAPNKGSAFLKQQTEMRNSAATADKTSGEVVNQTIAQYRDNVAGVSDPQTAAQLVTSLYNDPRVKGSAITAVPLDRLIAGIPQDPAQLEGWKQKFALGATKFMELNKPTITTRNLGGTTDTLVTEGLTGATRTVNSAQNTATPGDLLTDSRVREEGALNRSVTIRGQDKTDARARDANAIQSGQKTQQGVQDLRKEFNSLTEVKNFKEVLPIIQSVQRAPDTPAGDIDLIYGVGKIMDPNSVVREGEMTIVIKSGSPAQRLQGFYNYVKGGGRLSPTQRQELLAVMESRVSGLKSNYDAARVTYENAADKQGLPKDQIFIESPQPKATATPPTGGALSPEEQKELDALRARFGKGK